MGDLKVFLPPTNGYWGNGSPSSSPLPLQSLNPHPHVIGIDAWRRAEQVTQKIIWGIQPTTASEGRRRDVIEYVQNLMKRLIGCEVFSFGSVPLKAYLPDGDIDLTAFGPPNFESTLANDVCAVLEGEEQNNAAVFEVKDVQYIHAEVKLVKCLVQNIVVDISFNQIGGLCTLCFLEHVDHLIAKDHLFKRSIILIKAWCYYESRILGAHHGLISTYALETLVLYIFHFFHSSLDGPLAVLYRFLDYFGKFDWDNYCISLCGPVSLSSAPERVAEAPQPDGSALLFTPEFLKQCGELYSVPPRAFEQNANFRTFSAKHLNIVDPLRENNNLGRSVSKGSFYRIRSAFAYGARKLGRILLLPGEDIAGELNKFFMNTLERHGIGERRDVQDAFSRIPDSAVSDFDVSGSVLSKGDSMISETSSIDSHDGLCENLNSILILDLETEKEMGVQPGRQPCDHQLRNCLRRCTEGESNGFTEGNVVSGIRLAGDAKDLATSRATNRIHKPSPRKVEMVEAYHAPHLFFHQENGEMGNGKPDQLKATESGASMKVVASTRPLTTDEDISLASGEEPNNSESSSSEMLHFCCNDRVLTSFNRENGPLILTESTCSSDNLSPTTCSLRGNKGIQDPCSTERDLGCTSECPEAAYGLSDLGSDFDTHFANLLYAQTAFYDHEYMVGWPIIPMQPPTPHFHHKAWDTFHRQNTLPHMNVKGAVPGPPFSPRAYIQSNPAFISGAYGMEDVPKPRGTGTYFPNTSHHSYRVRRQPPRSRNNGRAMTREANLTDKVGQEQHPQAQTPGFSGSGRGKSPITTGLPLADGFTSSSSGGRLEFGSFGPVQSAAISPESDKNLESGDPHNQGSVRASTEHQLGTSSNCNRVTQLYLLRDEDDFPPLSETKGG